MKQDEKTLPERLSEAGLWPAEVEHFLALVLEGHKPAEAALRLIADICYESYAEADDRLRNDRGTGSRRRVIRDLNGAQAAIRRLAEMYAAPRNGEQQQQKT